jgi:hypothetical protein
VVGAPGGGAVAPAGGAVRVRPPDPGRRPTRGRGRLYLAVGVLVAGVAAGVVALMASGGSDGNRQCDRAGICFDLPEGWAIGEAQPGEGTLERDDQVAAAYRHQEQGGINDVANALARSDGCQVEPTEVEVDGNAGARCDNPEGESPQLIVAALADDRAWRVFFPPGLPDDEVEAVVDGIEFDPNVG